MTAAGAALRPSLPAGWERTTLGELARRTGGVIQTGPFGSQLHASDYVPVGVPTVMPVNIGDNRIVERAIARISEADAQRLSRHRLRVGDIVYSRRGDVEKSALVRDGEAGWLCGTGCLLVRVVGDDVDPTFVSYWLGEPSTRAWIVRHAVGDTMPNLNTGILSAVPVSLPTLGEQRGIAATLGALDDKSEGDRRLAAMLWSVAELLFQQLIQNGKLRALESCLALEYGKALPATAREPGTVPVFGSGGVAGSHSRALVGGPAVIVGRKGTVGAVYWSADACFPIDTTYYAVPRAGVTALFAYFALRSAGLGNMNSDSAVPGLNRTAALARPVLVPTDEAIREWDVEVNSLIQRADAAQRESARLGRLRDALLPELMSGRIRVPEAQEAVEDAVG